MRFPETISSIELLLSATSSDQPFLPIHLANLVAAGKNPSLTLNFVTLVEGGGVAHMEIISVYNSLYLLVHLQMMILQIPIRY